MLFYVGIKYIDKGCAIFLQLNSYEQSCLMLINKNHSILMSLRYLWFLCFLKSMGILNIAKNDLIFLPT